MPDLTTLYQAVARGGGWSRASRTGGLFVGGANKKRMSRDNCRCIGGGESIHPSKLPGAGLGLFGDVTFQPGDWITAMDGVVFGGPDSVPENVQRGSSESHFCTLHYGTLCLDGRCGSHPPHGVGGGSYANDASHNGMPNNATLIKVLDPSVPTLPTWPGASRTRSPLLCSCVQPPTSPSIRKSPWTGAMLRHGARIHGDTVETTGDDSHKALRSRSNTKDTTIRFEL